MSSPAGEPRFDPAGGLRGPRTVRLAFSCPASPDTAFTEEFFVGAWHPTADLQVTTAPGDGADALAEIGGRNWRLWGAKSPFEGTRCLVHGRGEGRDLQGGAASPAAVAFRGYLLEPPIHTWSASAGILRYFQQGGGQHNGVFAAAVLGHDAAQLTLVTDAFGMGSLYYRELNGCVLFSTNSRFLSAAGDQLDYTTAKIILHCRSAYGNGTLLEPVHRVPGGSTITFSDAGVRTARWFDMSQLPTGDRPMSPEGVREVEQAFEAAVTRCLALEPGDSVLPLSSGYDSRRILAVLRSRAVPFCGLTVRALHAQGYDLDAPVAEAMAAAMHFDHRVVELPVGAAFRRLDRNRQILVDALGTEHTWFFSMAPHFPRRPSLIWDGLGGDVLGATGFEDLRQFEAAPDRQLELMLEALVTDELASVLAPGLWPDAGEIRRHLAAFLTGMPPSGRNRTDYGFLITRTRSGPGMSAQRLVPAGHVTVFPFFDLPYVAKSMEFDSAEKIMPNDLQARCLEAFWPEYFAYPGSHRIPPGTVPVAPVRQRVSGLAALADEPWALRADVVSGLRTLVRPKAFGAALLAAASVDVERRVSWWLAHLVMILARHAGRAVCWSPAEGSPAAPSGGPR